MVKNLEKKILFLLGAFFLFPYGLGITGFPGLQTLDFPKIIPAIFSLIILLKFDFKRVEKVSFLFLIFIFLHGISVIYSFNYKSATIDFLSNLFLYYSGFFVPFILIKDSYSLEKLASLIKNIFLIFIILAITEFIFQFNFYDLIRNSYINQETRFNQGLGLARLGYKSSMGPFASTLPFSYTLVCLFFLSKLIISKTTYRIKNNLIDILGLFAIFLTLSRAAIFVSIFLYFAYNFFQKKIRNLIIFIFFILIASSVILKQINQSIFEDYIENYIVNIFSGSSGIDYRANSNKIDFNYALESPIIGHGSGQLYQAKTSKKLLKSTDSSYLLTVFADRGFISLLIFIIILFYTSIRALKLMNVQSELNLKSLIFAFIGLFLCLNSSQRFEVLFLFCFLMGLINKLYIIHFKNVSINNSPHIQ